MKEKISLKTFLIKEVQKKKKNKRSRLVFKTSDLETEPCWEPFWSTVDFCFSSCGTDPKCLVVKTEGSKDPGFMDDEQLKKVVNQLTASQAKVSCACSMVEELDTLVFADQSFSEEVLVDSIALFADRDLKLLSIRNLKLSQKFGFAVVNALPEAGLRNLAHLDLTNSQISDKNLTPLLKCFKLLETLVLFGNNEINGNFHNVVPLSLKTLDIGSCRFLDPVRLKYLLQTKRDDLVKLRIDFPDGMDAKLKADYALLDICQNFANLQCLELGGEPAKGVKLDVYKGARDRGTEGRGRKPFESAFRAIVPSESKKSETPSEMPEGGAARSLINNFSKDPVSNEESFPNLVISRSSTKRSVRSEGCSSSSQASMSVEQADPPPKPSPNVVALHQNIMLDNGKKLKSLKNLIAASVSKQSSSSCASGEQCNLSTKLSNVSFPRLNIVELEAEKVAPRPSTPPKSPEVPEWNMFGLGRGRNGCGDRCSSTPKSKNLFSPDSGIYSSCPDTVDSSIKLDGIRLPYSFGVKDENTSFEKRSPTESVSSRGRTIRPSSPSSLSSLEEEKPRFELPRMSPSFDGLCGIGLLKKLRVLTINFAIDDRSLLSIACDCGQLKELRVCATNNYYTNSGVNKIGYYTSRIEVLELHSSALDDSCIKGIATLKNLKELDLSGTSIGDSIVQVMKKCTKLASLNMSGTKISGEGVRECVELTAGRKFRFNVADTDDLDVVRDNLPHIPANVTLTV